MSLEKGEQRKNVYNFVLSLACYLICGEALVGQNIKILR